MYLETWHIDIEEFLDLRKNTGDDRRCGQLGLMPVFPAAENPFPWMSEAMSLKKERNFFETRVIDYQSGGPLAWD